MLVSAFIKIDGFDISSIKLSFLNGTLTKIVASFRHSASKQYYRFVCLSGILTIYKLNPRY